MNIREENLNIMLAELLAERGLKALGEVILKKAGRRPEPDVIIVLNGVRIVIEGKKLGMWEELVKQSQKRIDDNVCDLCTMVEYLDVNMGTLHVTQSDIKQSLLKSRFNVGFVSYIDRVGLDKWTGITRKHEKYTNIGFEDLLTFLMSAYSQVVREDVLGPVIAKMDSVLTEFADQLSSSVDIERLSEVLELGEKESEDDE